MKQNTSTLILLLGLLFTSLTAETFEENIDRPGNDYLQLGNLRDASVCQDKCKQDNNCAAWTFVKKNTIQGSQSQCYLKNSVPNKVPNTATISGTVLHYPPSFEENIDRPGNDFLRLGNLRDAFVCHDKCQENTRCVAWTFVTKNTTQGPQSQCYLKDSVPNKVSNTATISGTVNREVAQPNTDIPTKDEIKRYIAMSGGNIYFKKESLVSTLSQRTSMAIDEIVGGVAGRNIRGASLRQEACTDVDQLQNCKLKKIVDMIKQNGELKLYISIKNKVGGLANDRVKSIKAYLAWYGLTPGSEYHVQKVSKADKREREWLSQNDHLWIRVGNK